MQRSIGALSLDCRAVGLLVHRPRFSLPPTPTRNRRMSSHTVASSNPISERALVGEDFGARDPTAGELGSNFGEKVLGNFNTEHIIKPPEAIGEITGLKNKKCVPCEGNNVPKLDDAEINRLRLQCPGWRVTSTEAGVTCLACDWKVKNFVAGLELMQRIGKVAEEEGHHPDFHLTGYNNLTAQVSTHAVSGLTQNDFILAAKINELEISDLMPKRKPKFWA